MYYKTLNYHNYGHMSIKRPYDCIMENCHFSVVHTIKSLRTTEKQAKKGDILIVTIYPYYGHMTVVTE